jgi:type II secretory pathway predicted ATPase ExeA
MLAKTPKERFESARAVAREANRILDELGSRSAARVPKSAPAGSPAAPSARPRETGPIRDRSLFESLPTAPACEPLASRLGFFRRPFTPVDGETCPYQGEPFAGLVGELVGHLDAVPGAVLLVAGEAGSGRTTLCRRAAAALSDKHTVLGFDLTRSELPGALLEQLRRAAAADPAAPPSGRADELGPLIERIASERQSRGRPPILVLDGVGTPGAPEAEIARLIGGAGWSWTFSTVLVGSPGLSERMHRAGLRIGGGSLREICVPPLDGAQVAAYVASWLRAARAPDASPLLISPDALLLVAHRARGLLSAINCIAENMLILAASEGRRVVSSWEAWAAPMDERWSGALSTEALPRRPSTWPTKEAIAQLDACRAAAGLPLLSRSFAPRP